MTAVPEGATRFEKRRAQTRAALLLAAQSFLAEGRPGVAVQEVTARADVGIGSFYNHFASKDELFAAAVADAVERFADVLDALGDDLSDPAALFAHSFRVTGRLHRLEPQLSRVLLAQGHELSRAEVGIGPRARRDLLAGQQAGRFELRDIDRAMVLVTGAMIELGHLLHDQPDRDAAETVDAVASDVLVGLGLSRDEADAICATPVHALPDLL